MQSTIGGAKRVRKETNEVDAALNALLDAKWLKRKRDAAAIPVAPDQLPPAAVLALLTSLESSLEKSSAVASACERVFESFCDERQHLPGTLVRLLRLMGILSDRFPEARGIVCRHTGDILAKCVRSSRSSLPVAIGATPINETEERFALALIARVAAANSNSADEAALSGALAFWKARHGLALPPPLRADELCPDLTLRGTEEEYEDSSSRSYSSSSLDARRGRLRSLVDDAVAAAHGDTVVSFSSSSSNGSTAAHDPLSEAVAAISEEESSSRSPFYQLFIDCRSAISSMGNLERLLDPQQLAQLSSSSAHAVPSGTSSAAAAANDDESDGGGLEFDDDGYAFPPCNDNNSEIDAPPAESACARSDVVFSNSSRQCGDSAALSSLSTTTTSSDLKLSTTTAKPSPSAVAAAAGIELEESWEDVVVPPPAPPVSNHIEEDGDEVDPFIGEYLVVASSEAYMDNSARAAAGPESVVAQLQECVDYSSRTLLPRLNKLHGTLQRGVSDASSQTVPEDVPASSSLSDGIESSAASRTSKGLKYSSAAAVLSSVARTAEELIHAMESCLFRAMAVGVVPKQAK